MSASVNLSAEKRVGKNYKNFREMQENNDNKYPTGMENDQKALNFSMKTQAKNISTQTHRCLEDDIYFCEPENSSSVSVLPLQLSLSNTLLPPHHINFGNSKNNLYRCGKNSDSVCQESCSRCEFNDSTFSTIDVENKPHSSSPSVSSSALPSTSLPLLSSSPTNCCYTISSHSKDRQLVQENIYGLSNKTNKKQTSPKEYFNPRYEICSGKSEEIEKNKSFIIHKSTKSKTSPPPVPPKPLKKKRICTNYNNANEIPKILQSENAVSFRRKLHKFEKQNTSIGKFKNSVIEVSDVEHDQDDERCEFLACFSASNNVHLDQSVSDNSCVGANKHLSISECEQDCNIVYTSIEGSNNSINIIKKNKNFDATSREFSSILSDHQWDVRDERKCLGKPDKKVFRYDSFGRLKNIETSASLVNCPDSINTNSLNGLDLEKPSSNLNFPVSAEESVTIPNSVVIRNLTPKFNRERNLRADEIYSRRCASDDSLDSRIQIFFDKEKLLNNYIDQRNPHPDYQEISTSVLSGSVLRSVSRETETGTNTNRCKCHYQHLLPNYQKQTRNVENNKIFKSFSDTSNVNPAKCLTSDNLIGARRNLGSLFHSASTINEPNCEVNHKKVNRSLNDIEKKKDSDDRKTTSGDQCYAKNDQFNLENYIYDKDADCYTNSSDSSYCHSSVDECCGELSKLRTRIDTTESLSENSSSSSLSKNCSLPIVRRPLVLKRIPAIRSFEYASSSHMTAVTSKEIKMDKHRNTLDRWQRLGFGRRSSPTTNQEKANKSLDKSERLKELTELLRKNRSSPTPPPVPPPRKSRHIISAASSLHNTSNPVLLHLSTQSDDIRLMDQEEQHVSKTNITTFTTDQKARSVDDDMLYNKKNNNSNINNIRNNDTTFSLPSDKRKLSDSLKPNMSLSNIETLLTQRKKSKSPPVDQTKVDCEIPINLPRPESRTVIGSYARKGIPFRSASFSQIDYSSGKYIGGTLTALRDRLRREKLPENNSHQFLLLNKDNVRSWQNGKRNNTDETVTHIPLKTNAVTSPDQDKTTTDVIQEKNFLYKERKQDPQEQEKEEEHKYLDQKKVYILEDTQKKQEEPKNSIVIQNENNCNINVEVRPKDNKPAEILASAAQNIEGQEIQAPYFANELSEVFESNLATLVEEEVILESPPDNFLQTATTCLIPVPVYECSAQEWNLENPLQEWVDVAADEFGIHSDSVYSTTPVALKGVTEQYDSKQHVKEIVPVISVSQHTRENAEVVTEIDNKESPHYTGQHTNQSLFDVRKRDSHVDMEVGSENRSSLDCSLQRFCSNADEKKRKDKSKRRIGIYIENADWAEASEVTSSTEMGLDISLGNCSVIKANQSDDCSLVNNMYSSDIEEVQTPESMYPFGLIRSESNKSQAWTEEQPQISLSCQISEEKEETNLVSQQNHQNQFFPCSESISDNENDRNLLSSRDRLSPSPALSDQDYKRYSKRPPRGPYGQMLEAEMKKPNRLHFEEMYDELKHPESSGRRDQGNNPQNKSHDENAPVIPQYSNSFRGRKSNTYLPIPTHTRAASTPSQMENISEVLCLSKINSLDKRYQSNFDNSVRSNIKYYTDVKRATSEATSSRPSHKRSSSLLSSDKEMKQNSDGSRILQTNRSPICENADSKHKARGDYTKDLLPSTKLLAELLQGASEKLISEQHQQKCAVSL